MKYLLLFTLCLGFAFPIFSGGRQQPQNQTAPSNVPSTQPVQAPIPTQPIAPSPLINNEQLLPDQASIFPFGDLWEIDIYPYDAEALNQGIGQRIIDGFRPVGLNVITEASVLVLYVRLPLEEREWRFQPIFPLSQVNAEFSQILVEGWLPIDFSLSSEDFHAIFIPSPVSMLSWRIFSFNLDELTTPDQILAELRLKVEEQIQSNRYIFGVATSGNLFHVLFVQPEIPPTATQLQMMIYPNDGITPFIGMDTLIGQGSIPAGIAFTNDFVFIPFYY